jgi:hypothetical protein
VPAQYRVIVTHRSKFACRACERVVQENALEHLIKSGLPVMRELGAGGIIDGEAISARFG